eukprot:4697432-Ditylum_brightwellii.AAC.1
MDGGNDNATSNHTTEEPENKNEDQRRKDANEDTSSSSLSTPTLCACADNAFINLTPYIDATECNIFVDQVLADPS